MGLSTPSELDHESSHAQAFRFSEAPHAVGDGACLLGERSTPWGR